MTGQGVRKLAKILALSARMEGMKAENLILMHNHKIPGYTLVDFNKVAQELDKLAEK